MPTTTPYPAPSGRIGAIVFVAMLDDDKLKEEEEAASA